MFFSRLMGSNRISPDKAREMIEKGEATLVDVRTPGEFEQGYIKGALLIPLDRLSSDAKNKLPDKEKPILVYCLSGSRSRSAAGLLSGMGYKNVHDLGGISSWPYGIVR
mgnify:FL=1